MRGGTIEAFLVKTGLGCDGIIVGAFEEGAWDGGGANVGADVRLVEGSATGGDDGSCDGVSEGPTVGKSVGVAAGATEGVSVGATDVGAIEGVSVGRGKDVSVGGGEGVTEGSTEGVCEGSEGELPVGSTEGDSEGEALGCTVTYLRFQTLILYSRLLATSRMGPTVRDGMRRLTL